MQKGERVTWWAGFSSALPSSAPMKNLPPEICTMSAGQVGGGGGGGGMGALAEGAKVDDCTALPPGRARSKKRPPPTHAAATTPPATHLGLRARGARASGRADTA